MHLEYTRVRKFNFVSPIYVAKEGSLVSFSTLHKGTLRGFCFYLSFSLSLSLSLSLSFSLSLITKQRACFNDDSFFVAGAFYAFSLATPIELIDFIGCGILLFDTKRQRACIIYRPCIGCLETNRDNCLSFTIQLSYIQILYILVTYNATRN